MPDRTRRRGFGPEHVVFFSPRSYTQPYYNIDVIIAAAVRVREREPRARFLFAGYEGDPRRSPPASRAAGPGRCARWSGASRTTGVRRRR